MSEHWQTWTALAIVFLTAILYTRRILKRKKGTSSGSCDSDCACEKPKKK